VRGGADGQPRWPLRPSCSGEGGSGEAGEREASFGGCKGRWGTACFGAQPARGGSSAGAAAMAPAGDQASGREVVREGEGDGLVYRQPTSMPVTKGPTAHA
jgi:hypothetical protein